MQITVLYRHRLNANSQWLEIFDFMWPGCFVPWTGIAQNGRWVYRGGLPRYSPFSRVDDE